MDTPLGILVCRMDSARLPGKPLRQVNGQPLLWYIVSRCRRVAELAGRLAIATSDRAVDDPLARYAEQEGLGIYRGAAANVARRVLRCAQHHGADWFFRINGDSPFLEPRLLRQAYALAVTEPLDLITNLKPRSFPIGVTVEAVRTAAFLRACERMDRPHHFEHVTAYLYEHLHEFRWRNLSNEHGNQASLKLTVDTPADLRWFRRLIHHFGSRWDQLTFWEAAAWLRAAGRAA